MNNFDLDDPLGDLLSEGSNDSFFETVKKDKNVTTRDKKENLFGLPTTSSSTTLMSPPVLTTTIEQPKVTPSTPNEPIIPAIKKTSVEKTSTSSTENNAPKKGLSFESEDIFSDLGFDPKKAKAKTNIFDDLLGTPQNKPKKLLDTPVSKDLNRPKTAPQNKVLSRQSTETNSENLTTEINTLGTYNPLGSRRGGRRKSSITAVDPLGLVSSNEEKRDNNKKAIGMDWLSLNDDSQMPAKTPKTSGVSPKDVISSIAQHSDQAAQPQIVLQQPNLSSLISLGSNITKNPQILDVVNNETKNSLYNLKQQESQLLIAGQMRNQETILLEMQQKQQSLLEQQELQFNDLLQKQVQRQNNLEETIRMQQERINSHIQLLMMQPQPLPLPPASISTANLNATAFGGADIVDKKELLELEAEIKRLELEKLRLEDILSNAQENHEKELTMMEKSYKNQINHLQEQLAIVGERFRDELKNIDEFYKNKIEALINERNDLLDLNQKIIKDNEHERTEAIEKLRKKYESDMEYMQNEHKTMISNIRDSKLMEFSLIQENSSYLHTLKSATNNLNNASEDLQQLKDVLQENLDSIHKEKEIQLQARAKSLDDQQRMIERTRETNEKERNRLLDLILTLETKLNSLTQASTEEQWSLREKLASLDVERAAFEKEKTFFREQLIKDEQRMTFMRESQLAERDQIAKQLEEDRIALLTEKSKFDTMMRLRKDQSSVVTTRAEIDAAIRVADDARQQSDAEREKLIDMQKECDNKKRELNLQENSIRNKKSELEIAINAAVAREKVAENSINNAKSLETILQFKVKMLQKYFQDIASREADISKAKMELSRERLELEAIRKKVNQSKCSICKIGEQNEEIYEMRHAMNFENELQNLMNDKFEIKDNLGAATTNDSQQTLVEDCGTKLDTELIKLKFDIMTDFD